MQLHVIGDGEHIPVAGDSVLLRVRIAALDSPPGSFFSTERWYAVADLRSGALGAVMDRSHEGDSMSVITQGSRVPWRTLSARSELRGSVRLEFSIREIRTKEMIHAARALKRTTDPEGFQHDVITAYLLSNEGNWERWGNSDLHHHIEGDPLDTSRVRHGDLVTITYVGMRLEDEQVFDDTERNGEPFTFRYGDTDQLIRGLEVAVSLLREGQHGTFVIPSEMAFGARGLADVVTPNEPVVYRVELVRVVRGPAAG